MRKILTVFLLIFSVGTLFAITPEEEIKNLKKQIRDLKISNNYYNDNFVKMNAKVNNDRARNDRLERLLSDYKTENCELMNQVYNDKISYEKTIEKMEHTILILVSIVSGFFVVIIILIILLFCLWR